MVFIYAKGTQLYCGESPILLRGFGLGGWFLPEGYMWKLYTKCDRPRRMEALIETLCGNDYATQFWETYFDSYITEQDIKHIAARGYNSVRMPINARKLYHMTDSGLIFDAATIQRLDLLIAWCRKYGIYVILDMHGAPGGQTGANIDDSASDLPELFMDDSNVEILTELWQMLALRYKDEPAVAGYDLLNEPLPNWFNAHNDKLMPLYAKLIAAIRAVDTNHLIILEGLHWSTDFSIFSTKPNAFAIDGIVLEFHKYWSNPDAESLQLFLEASEKWNVPLFMGEGGENNNAWYTTAFPLYERLGISWSFWSYKKMACTNSPMTFEQPKNWHLVLDYIDAVGTLSQEEAIVIFDALLDSIKASKTNEAVYNALDRRVPVHIPAEAYDAFECHTERTKGANLRDSEPISILFESRKLGDVDYKRYGGEPQPDDENLVVMLNPSDSVSYNFKSDFESIQVEIKCYGDGALSVDVQNTTDDAQIITLDAQNITLYRRVSGPTTLVLNVPMKHNEKQSETLKITCDSGTLYLDTLTLLKGDAHESHTDAL
jgi:hypothetical protein